jgi:MFS family permease
VEAAIAVGLFGPCNTIGRLIMGWLLDRLHAPYISATAALLPLIYVALYFNFNGTFAYAVVMGITLGLASGAESNAVAYMVSRYFGLRQYGSIFGLVFGCHAAGFACGPLVGGLFYDHFGGYDDDCGGPCRRLGAVRDAWPVSDICADAGSGE